MLDGRSDSAMNSGFDEMSNQSGEVFRKKRYPQRVNLMMKYRSEY